MILMYGFLRIARSVAIVGLDRREFIRPPSSLPQPCFVSHSIPFICLRTFSYTTCP